MFILQFIHDQSIEHGTSRPKRANRFCCKLAPVVYGARRQHLQLLRSVGQRSRSPEVDIGQTCERDNSKTDEQIVLQIGTNSSQDKEIKRSTFRVKRSKVKVT